jgi:citrate synthase
MAMLRTAVSAMAFYDPEAEDMSDEANRRKAIRMTAQIPTIIAAFDRFRNGTEPVEPRSDLGTAANFIYMLNGEPADDLRVRTFDAALVLHAEHGMNASTFAARVTAGTLADIYSAVVSAIGTLKGPSHGGANVRVMEMLRRIDESGEDAATWVRDALGRKERIMGFGHRVYKTVDPRASILSDLLEGLSEEKGERKWYEMSREMMETVGREKGLYPNVDFFSASVYYLLGIEKDLYTPIFAISRITGWTAHLLEQWKENRLIRPRAEYVGPRGKTVRPIAERQPAE